MIGVYKYIGFPLFQSHPHFGNPSPILLRLSPVNGTVFNPF